MAGMIKQEMEDEKEPMLPGDPSTPDDTQQHEDAESSDFETKEKVAEGDPNEVEDQDELTAESARAQMKLPDQLRQAYERVVDGGLKLMFSPQTREQTLQFMQGAGDPAEKMGEGVAAVMATLFKQSNNTMPPEVIIPAGVELLLHAVDVVKKSGGEWSQDDTAESMANMVEAIFRQFGTSLDQVGGMMQQGGAA